MLLRGVELLRFESQLLAAGVTLDVLRGTPVPLLTDMLQKVGMSGAEISRLHAQVRAAEEIADAWTDACAQARIKGCEK